MSKSLKERIAEKLTAEAIANQENARRHEVEAAARKEAEELASSPPPLTEKQTLALQKAQAIEDFYDHHLKHILRSLRTELSVLGEIKLDQRDFGLKTKDPKIFLRLYKKPEFFGIESINSLEYDKFYEGLVIRPEFTEEPSYPLHESYKISICREQRERIIEAGSSSQNAGTTYIYSHRSQFSEKQIMDKAAAKDAIEDIIADYIIFYRGGPNYKENRSRAIKKWGWRAAAGGGLMLAFLSQCTPAFGQEPEDKVMPTEISYDDTNLPRFE